MKQIRSLKNQRRVYFQPQTSLCFESHTRPALIYGVKIQIAYQVLSLQCAVLQFSVCVWVTLCLWSHTLLQLLVHKSNSVTWSAFTHWCSYPDRVNDWLWRTFSLSLYVGHKFMFSPRHIHIHTSENLQGFERPPTLCCASSV